MLQFIEFTKNLLHKYIVLDDKNYLFLFYNHNLIFFSCLSWIQYRINMVSRSGLRNSVNSYIQR